jgi:hypothetical protein
MAKYAPKILFFFCRPCSDYHEKTHPHYDAKNQRTATRSEDRGHPYYVRSALR